jgi:signal transduction histidine kinase
LFDTTGNSLIAGVENHKKVYTDLNEIINNHGKKSEIEPDIFFIQDYTDQYSYIIRQPVVKTDTSQALLYCTLRSKKIPEEIGFPRLLISSEAQVFEPLESYSIAKYHNGRLVNKYGDYNYPFSVKPIRTWKKDKEGYVNYDGYNHYILERSQNDMILLSSQNSTWVEIITSFSYLFSFYGILLFPILFQFNYTPFFRRTLSLAVKIQLVLIGLVFVSLFAFGWGSGIFVKNQYNHYTNDVIREKLASVDIELKNKLGEENHLSITSDGNYMEYLLQKFSKVFVTDINLYDTEGFLLASSRPKVFNIGLLSEQMNPSAVHSFIVRNKSEYVHEERIGELKYASAYLPFINHDGKSLGYLNLQHFGQQQDFEEQIQGFLVAIINVFMLLLAISIVLAIFISNWLTAPLRLLQENFANIRFGKYNQQISYDKEDEIGALVKDYNQKLIELEYTAQQLAQSERESAWREMAKQVAHEIKNPLTPMKLSVQQLLRVYDPNDPNSEKKLQKVAGSIIEQIDALTNIANEFSNFAKMPKPDEVTLDLIPLLENVIEVFRQDNSCKIELSTTEKSILIKADKDQMVRTFNNLINNAIQAIPENREGNVQIILSKENGKIHIELKDNGTGIPEGMRSKIFVPYFTTKSTGTGLGLAMVKQIIENHRGTIDFDSVENIGTSIIIELPEALNNKTEL